MLKKVEAKCKRCGKEFCRKRTAQDYCSAQCRKAAWSDTKKRRLMPSKLVAAVRASRAQRRRPSLRLVVSNPKPSVPNAEAA